MHRFCGTLSLCKEVQKAATCIAKKAVDLDIVPGRSPISVAAAAIYMASQVCVIKIINLAQNDVNINKVLNIMSRPLFCFIIIFLGIR